jgi:hypothetical protein
VGEVGARRLRRFSILSAADGVSHFGDRPDNFDNSELTAWRSAPALRELLAQLNSEYPSNVRIFAHSLGNVVVGETLRQATNGPVALVYAALQAALPSHSYDASSTNRTISFPWDSGTPNIFAHYWTSTNPCYFNGVSGASTCINFFNPVDYALSGGWEMNQDMKPDDTQGYVYNNGIFYHNYPITGTAMSFPTNTYELFAYAVEARCRALGAQVNVGGAFVRASEVDLNGPGYSFGSPHKGHSAEFRSSNMNRAAFWNRLLIRMQLKED